MPAVQTLTASRNATWAPQLVYDYAGAALPIEGATISMQLRLFPGQPGEPKLSLSDIPFIDELTTGEPSSEAAWRRITLSPSLSSGELSALPGSGTSEAGGIQSFAFDILISYADGLSEILSSGQFVVSPGVTIA